MRKFLIVIGLSIASQNLNASVGSQLDSWFDNSNVTNPGVYQGQSARQLSLGGFSARTPVDQVFHFVDVTSPKMSAGCGGIDFYAGGVSGLDADAFIQSLRNIGQNAKGLVFMLGISIVSPTLKNVMAQMKGYADQINQLSSDSCEAAVRLVGGAMEGMGKEDSTCIVREMNAGGLTWDQAKAICPKAPKESPKSGDANFAFTEGNLVWGVLMENDYFKNEKQLAEIVMNITGTLIITRPNVDDKDSPLTFRYITPSLGSNGGNKHFENIKNAILFGKNAPDALVIRECADTDKKICIPVSELKSVTPTWEGLEAKVNAQLKSIAAKIKNDEALSDSEKGLIAFSRLPIYRFIAAASAANSVVDLNTMVNKYSYLIAEDILYSYLDGLLMTTNMGVRNLRGGASGDPAVKEFSKSLDESIDGLASLQRDVNQKADDMEKMVINIRNYESQLIARISPPLQRAAMYR
ncbi:conjugal transfer protein TraH [Cellvibrio sp.]|uniref:conjugal transfer protein TraH n=1 Tax=Cellvibrio sp. TaxID=1965322 RepID=UPI0039648294